MTRTQALRMASMHKRMRVATIDRIKDALIKRRTDRFTAEIGTNLHYGHLVYMDSGEPLLPDDPRRETFPRRPSTAWWNH